MRSLFSKSNVSFTTTIIIISKFPVLSREVTQFAFDPDHTILIRAGNTYI